MNKLPRMLAFAISFLILAGLAPFPGVEDGAGGLAAQAKKTRVLIVYFSATGNTEKMARAVAEGAGKVEGAETLLKTVAEVTRADVESADGLIIGSPVYYANMAAPVKQFIDDWYAQNLNLFDKVGGAFATGGGLTAGRETTINSLLLAMLNNGMIVAGPLYESWGTFGASAVTDAPDPGVSEYELNDARRLGERVARLALKLKG